MTLVGMRVLWNANLQTIRLPIFSNLKQETALTSQRQFVNTPGSGGRM
jgi:hypothetical protein